MSNLLNGLHPTLITQITEVLQSMQALGHPMKIVQGLRTAEYQAQLYAQGRTTSGHIVTNCDGYHSKSNHQAKEDGMGYAVDCAFLGDDPFGEHQPWALYGKMVVTAGLVWGGNWHSFVDRPHAELKL